MRRLVATATVALVAGGAGAGVAWAAGGADRPAPAPEPPGEVRPAEPMVPRAKFVTAVEGWRVARREVRALRRTLRHEPSVQEALTLASIVYGIDRRDLSATAWCESRHQPRARNGQYLGIMQLGTGFRAASPFFPALSPHSAYANVMAAAQVIARQGYRQWECSPRGAFRS